MIIVLMDPDPQHCFLPTKTFENFLFAYLGKYENLVVLVLNTAHNGLYTLRKKVLEPINQFLYSMLDFPYKDKTEKNEEKKIVVVKFVFIKGSNFVFGSAFKPMWIRNAYGNPRGIIGSIRSIIELVLTLRKAMALLAGSIGHSGSQFIPKITD
jgi:hypothetical protein